MHEAKALLAEWGVTQQDARTALQEMGGATWRRLAKAAEDQGRKETEWAALYASLLADATVRGEITPDEAGRSLTDYRNAG